MAELDRRDDRLAAILRRKGVFRKHVDQRALWISESDRLSHARADRVAPLGAQALLFKRGGDVAQVAARRDLKREPRQAGGIAALERDRLQTLLRGQKGAVLVALDHAEPDDLRVIVDLALEIQRG